jgi:hypothetical protein
LLYSATSDALAVWNFTGDEATLDVYTLKYFRMRRMQDDEAQLLVSTPLRLDSIMPDSAAWSPDGRILAFVDSRGIWLWDVFTPDSAPELLMETVTTLRGFSPMGRYLMLGDEATGQTIDLVNGAVYPPGLVAPDDRMLLTFGPEPQIIHFTPYSVSDLDYPENPVYQIQWYDNDIFLVLTCADRTQPATCQVTQNAAWRRASSRLYEGSGFAYDTHTDTLAMIKDTNTIAFRTPIHYGIYERDLSPWLDGDIAAIEWLPTLFYDD